MPTTMEEEEGWLPAVHFSTDLPTSSQRAKHTNHDQGTHTASATQPRGGFCKGH